MTKVGFRYNEEHQELFAFFPEENWDTQGNKTSYAHVGQHGACSSEYAAESRVATKKEYKELLDELENNVGYDDLQVLNKRKDYE